MSQIPSADTEPERERSATNASDIIPPVRPINRSRRAGRPHTMPTECQPGKRPLLAMGQSPSRATPRRLRSTYLRNGCTANEESGPTYWTNIQSQGASRAPPTNTAARYPPKTQAGLGRELGADGRFMGAWLKIIGGASDSSQHGILAGMLKGLGSWGRARRIPFDVKFGCSHAGGPIDPENHSESSRRAR